MEKQEKLEQLNKAMDGVKLLMNEAVKNVYAKEMLPLVQSTTNFKLKMKTDVYEDWCEITFDLGDWKKEWGFDFTISLTHDKLIELKHGWLSGVSKEQRPYLIERDKIIGKLWDKEEQIKAVFENVKKERNKLLDTYNALEREAWGIEREIAQEKRQHYLDMLSVGSKWVYKWELDSDYKRPMTIIKITPKLVFYHRTYGAHTRMKIVDMISQLEAGNIVRYEEPKEE